jgi:uncharacterized iron-regulated membrane protein
MKVWLLKLHRWVALIFALPLLFVLGTGLVLSFEPWLVVRAIAPNTLTADKLKTLLDQYDPAGQARAISYRSYDGTITIGGGRGGKVIDVSTGAAQEGPSALASLLTTMRRTHETLIYDLRWLVVASSFAMLALALLGILMGWPRFSNTMSGWHKAMAWGLLPLIVLSPLTGLFLAYGITFNSAPAAPQQQRAAPIPLAQAIQIVAKERDLSTLVWMRPLGGRLAARLVDGGEFRVFAVTPNGLTPLPRNLPRLWHEGNFAGGWSALMNIVLSVAMIGLLVTGAWIWLRRTFRRRRPRRAEPRAAA